MRKPSIQRKLRSVIMLTSTIVLLLAFGALIAADRASARGVVERDLSTLAEIVASNSTASLLFNDVEAGREVLAALRAKPSVVAAIVYTKEGKHFAIYPAGRGPTTLGQSDDAIEVTRDIVFDGEKIGAIYIASDLRDATARLRRFAAVAAIILMVSLVVAYVLSWRLQQVITRRILGLAKVAQQVTSKKNYSVRVPAPVSCVEEDEIGELMLGFNQMLAEIQRRDDELELHREELERQVEARTAELRSANGALRAAKETAEQIAEENAQLSRQQKMILNAAGEGILGVNRSGVTTFINPSGARMLASPVEELVGRQLHRLIHPQDASAGGFHDCPVCNGTYIANKQFSNTNNFVRPDGVTIPIEYTASPIIDDAGRESGVVVTFRDVTERLAVERMKNEFISTVSHELRTPLTSIRGALGLLGSGLLGNVSDRAKRMLEIAVSNTDRLVRLINDILDLERMESGRVELNRKVVDAGILMKEALEVVQPVADGAGVSIVIEPLHASLSVDQDRIVQTLTNLLGNAVKFSPPGTAVRLSGDVGGDKFIFSVTDQGRGIPADKLDSIFERFKQIDASDSRDKGGSGLGLAICRSIVVAHGGTIWAESIEQKGSTFRFTLPLDAPRRNAAESELAVDIRTVLICAEDQNATPAVVRMLEKRGFSTLVIDSLGQLRQAAAATRPHAIMIDLLAPTDQGWHVIGALKRSPDTANVPIILATAQPQDLFDRHAELIARWIPKPFTEAEIAGALSAVAMTCGEPTVLVVEDDVDLARVVTASLQGQGIRTVHATTGQEAIEACRREVPTLVVLDLVLPEVDGFAVVEWMRANAALATVPLIVFSAQEVAGADQERLRLGPTAFLTKSRVSLEEFANRVLKLLSTVTRPLEVEGAA